MDGVDVAILGLLILDALGILAIWIREVHDTHLERIEWTLLLVALGLGLVTFASGRPLGLPNAFIDAALGLQILCLVAIGILKLYDGTHQ